MNQKMKKYVSNTRSILVRAQTEIMKAAEIADASGDPDYQDCMVLGKILKIAIQLTGTLVTADAEEVAEPA